MKTVKNDIDELNQENSHLKLEREKIEDLFILGIDQLTPRPNMKDMFESAGLETQAIEILGTKKPQKSTADQVQELITRIKHIDGKRRVTPIKSKLNGTESPRKNPSRMLTKSNSFALESINLRIPSPRKLPDPNLPRKTSPTKTELSGAIKDAMEAKGMIKSLQAENLVPIGTLKPTF